MLVSQNQKFAVLKTLLSIIETGAKNM
jgi:hypothetical protein